MPRLFAVAPVILMLLIPAPCLSQAQNSVAPRSVEIIPALVEAEVGQQVKLRAVAKDAAGQPIDQKPSLWFAAPFDLAGVEDGTVTLYNPGEVRVGAIVGGKTGYAKIVVSPAPVVKIDFAPLALPLVVGGSTTLAAAPRTANGDPRNDVSLEWSSDQPSIARVDASGTVIGVAAGTATIRAKIGKGAGTVQVRVVRNDVRNVSLTATAAKARTGDVVYFSARATGAGGRAIKDAAVVWSVNRGGAQVYPDGAFVAEEPGTYLVQASSGQIVGTASIFVEPRRAEREIEVVGHILPKDLPTAEEWIVGKYAFLSSVSDKLWTYDISDPANPKLLDTLTVDARIINDISTTPDGRIGLMTREQASSRKNGIVFLDTSDPAHVRVLSEYTETVTGGVHSAFINTHYAYITDDATGSMRIIDFADPRRPKEVARFEVDVPQAKTVESSLGPMSAGRMLHDVYVKDGLAYLAYWREGLVILDVGNGMKGGSPEKPQVVSQLRFNYHELYGVGWLSGAHAVFRYKNYVFVGDEVFPGEFNLMDRGRIPVRGVLHVIDVSDLRHPRKVAEYAVPEAGAHNLWVDDDVLYMGYYNGGGRVLDVSGELRGDLYRQGREIGRLWTGHPSGFRPNLPFTWGAQPHNGLIFFNDINSGLWIAKLGQPKYKGSTTAPPLP